MKYLLSNLNKTDMQKLKSSDIRWYPDGITDDSQETTICFDTDGERDRAMGLLEIKNFGKRNLY